MDPSETVLIPEIRVDTLRPLIESFFARMTEEQWTLVKSGNPDDVTKVMLADLLVELITHIAKVVLMAIDKSYLYVSGEGVQSSLGDSLCQSFAEVLDVDKVQSVSSKELTDLFVEEVLQSISSVVSNGIMGPQLNHLTPPSTLAVMVCSACQMLKDFVARMCRPRPESSQTISVEMEDQSEPESVASVQEIITKEVTLITEPLWDEVPEPELLQSESSLEIQIFAEDIAQSRSETKTESVGPSFKPQQASNMFLKGLGMKVKDFFAKTLVNVSIHRIVGQVKNKFEQETEVRPESRESIQSLVADVNSLLLTEDDQTQTGGNEVCALQRLENLSPSVLLQFTQELSNLLYTHITNMGTVEIIPAPEELGAKDQQVSIPESHAHMYIDIHNKVICFLGLMSWWLNTQASRHSDRVTLALMDTELLATSQLFKETTPAGEAEDAVTRAKENKVLIQIFIEQLISQTLTNARVKWTASNIEAVIQHLFARTWAEVKDTDFNVTPEHFSQLHKAVFKDLCKRWGNAEMVLASMILRKPELEKYIVTSLKTHLTYRCTTCTSSSSMICLIM